MKDLYGRLLLTTDFNRIRHSVSKADFNQSPAMISVSTDSIKCLRCGSIHKKVMVRLPLGCFYCPTCINLGRVRSDESLYHFPQQNFIAHSYLRWSGKLTSEQQKIADSLVTDCRQHSQILVRAVTGAGKTEMIYPIINQYLRDGKSVAVVSPRIDVCIELHQRLSRDFSCKIPLLHGEGQPYFRAPLVIATTHQLLRFRDAFDLLIVDEVDAFPFADNPMLYFAACTARKPDSCLIYLTATTTDFLDHQIKIGALHQLELTQRFHGGKLTVPKLLWHTKFIQCLKKQRISRFPLLIFVPEIKFGESFTKKLKQKFPEEKIAFVSSKSKQRLNIVEDFRSGNYSILVTTSILERGVTFPEIDVFVLLAHHTNFTKSALIQMSGRVGRSITRPSGLVYFFHEGRTKAMLKAVQEIKKSNRRGGVL
ncbi:DEAD/DEAH box helicase [Lactococcus protaetiae]|uniref:DEAD/DEAH box helicase n=1 Tax=Lactococcus protaetiae TaxID=2592653 RepID=A0A514Z9D0_9LACT|nr:DEAD/DEAH box helicase [Lactococcus protaetiae]QDK71199.1 DEAD/DEAH box helicase [Lactococcus protaetiae]